MQTPVAFVVGSSKGIGKGIAQRLAQEGFFVYVTYHSDKEAGERALREIEEKGGKGSLISLDVRSPDSVAQAFSHVESEFGYLNALVISAVTEVAKNIEEATFDEWQLVTETKIDGTFLCIKLALPLLKAGENANLVVITSRDGEQPNPDYVAYCVGSAGAIALVKAMATYLPKYRIRVNAVSPGTTRTPLWDNLGGENEDMWKGFAATNPMGRIPTVEDVAEAVLLLINDPSRYLNGNFLYVNGGTHLK